MKRFCIFIIMVNLSISVFCIQITEFSASSFISICAFGYYQEYGTMPEKISDLTEKEYYYNTAGNLRTYSECGFRITLKKRGDNILDIYVDSENRQSHIIYTVEKLHHFEEYLNGNLIQEYFRDDSGKIIHLEDEKKIQNNKKEEAEDYDDYVIIKDILLQ